MNSSLRAQLPVITCHTPVEEGTHSHEEELQQHIVLSAFYIIVEFF